MLLILCSAFVHCYNHLCMYVCNKKKTYKHLQSHFAVDRAANFTMVQHHRVKVTPEDDYAMRGKALQQAMDEDMEKGLIPFFVSFVFY